MQVMPAIRLVMLEACFMGVLPEVYHAMVMLSGDHASCGSFQLYVL